jgi:micrococcal nuclease
MSGRLKFTITIVGLLAALCVSRLDLINAGRRAHYPPPVSQPTDFSDQLRYDQKEFTVTKVVDGDTLDIDAMDGNRLTTRIRLIGVDTPETKKPGTPVMYYGPEASEYARVMADGKLVTVWLDTISATRDRYGRLLAYVRLPDGRVLNELLLSEGYGYAYTVFKHGYSQKYLQLEASAKRAKKGLWAAVTEEQKPDWLQKKDAKRQGR